MAGSSSEVEEGTTFTPKFGADGLVTAVVTDVASPLIVSDASFEVASLADPVTRIDGVSTVEPFAGVATTSVGAVRSMLTVFEIVAGLPATSVAEPVTAWLAPSFAST